MCIKYLIKTIIYQIKWNTVIRFKQTFCRHYKWIRMCGSPTCIQCERCKLICYLCKSNDSVKEHKDWWKRATQEICNSENKKAGEVAVAFAEWCSKNELEFPNETDEPKVWGIKIRGKYEYLLTREIYKMFESETAKATDR